MLPVDETLLATKLPMTVDDADEKNPPPSLARESNNDTPPTVRVEDADRFPPTYRPLEKVEDAWDVMPPSKRDIPSSTHRAYGFVMAADAAVVGAPSIYMVAAFVIVTAVDDENVGRKN